MFTIQVYSEHRGSFPIAARTEEEAWSVARHAVKTDYYKAVIYYPGGPGRFYTMYRTDYQDLIG